MIHRAAGTDDGAARDHADGPDPVVAAPPAAGIALGVATLVRASRRQRAVRAGALVAAATMLANVLGYAFNVVLARGLGADGYGALGALLGLALIGGVPALAQQAVVARRTAVAPAESAPAQVAALLRASVVVGLVTAGIAVLLAPLVTAYLRLPGPAAALWLAASLLPLVVVCGLQGVLQGRQRFARLGLLFVAAAALRLLGGTASVLLDGGVAGALAGTAAGSLVACGFGWALVRGAIPVPLRGSAGREPVLRELAGAGLGLLSLVVLANVDVLLARRHLPAREAGLYAAGAVFAKGAFWAPQAVVVLVFPRLSATQSPRLLQAALAAVAGCGAVLVVAVALLAEPLVPLVFGAEYAEVAGTAWAFTLLGAVLAVAQLLVFRGIAHRSTRLAVLAALVAVGEAVVITLWLNDTVAEVVGAAAGAALVLVLLGLLPAVRRSALTAQR